MVYHDTAELLRVPAHDRQPGIERQQAFAADRIAAHGLEIAADQRPDQPLAFLEGAAVLVEIGRHGQHVIKARGIPGGDRSPSLAVVAVAAAVVGGAACQLGQCAVIDG